MRTGLLVAIVLLTTADPVLARQDHRIQAAVVAGGGRTWDDEGSIGTGVVAGGRVQWRLFGGTSIDGSLDVLTHERQAGTFEASGTSVILGGSLVHRFGGAAARPYVLEGIDLVRHTGSTRFGGNSTDRESTDFGFHVGGGLGVRVSDRIELGPEGRFYFIQPADSSAPAWAYWIGGRLGF